jgi:dipeptidyl aminopeptidase/acylaminoacyl peptidase
LLLGALAVLPGREAVAAGQNGLLAFASDRGGSFDIYVMGTDGSAVTGLTSSAGADTDPAWSLDAARLAFVSDRDGNAEVYVMSADGSAQADLTRNAAADTAPSWSPDGTKLAFVSDRDGNAEIYAMSADGSAQKDLSNHAGRDTSPAWSPDGSRLAFVSTPGAVTSGNVPPPHEAGSGVVWHDARLRAPAEGVVRVQWRIPLLVDGRPTRLVGSIRRLPRPSHWAPAGLAGLLAGATAILLLWRRRRMLARVAPGAGALAAAAVGAVAISFALSGYATAATLVTSVDEILFAAVGVGLLVRAGPAGRAGAVAGLGLLALFTGGTKVAALLHSGVLSALPSDLARSVVVLALTSGAVAAACGCVLLLDVRLG